MRKQLLKGDGPFRTAPVKNPTKPNRPRLWPLRLSRMIFTITLGPLILLWATLVVIVFIVSAMFMLTCGYLMALLWLGPMSFGDWVEELGKWDWPDDLFYTLLAPLGVWDRYKIKEARLKELRGDPCSDCKKENQHVNSCLIGHRLRKRWPDSP